MNLYFHTFIDGRGNLGRLVHVDLSESYGDKTIGSSTQSTAFESLAVRMTQQEK